MNDFESKVQSGIDNLIQSIYSSPSDYINTRLSDLESEALQIERQRLNQEIIVLRSTLKKAFSDELLQDQKLTSSEWNLIFTSIPPKLRQRFKIKSHKDLFKFIFCLNDLSKVSNDFSINREGHIIRLWQKTNHVFNYNPVDFAIRYDMQTGKQIYSIFDLVDTHILNVKNLGRIVTIQKDGFIEFQNGAARIDIYSGELVWQKEFGTKVDFTIQDNKYLVFHKDSMSILNPNTGQLDSTHKIGDLKYVSEDFILNKNNQLIVFSPDYESIEYKVSLPECFQTDSRLRLKNIDVKGDDIYQYQRKKLVIAKVNTTTGDILFTREFIGDCTSSSGLFHNMSQNKLISISQQDEIQELILPEEGSLKGNIFILKTKHI